jgi:IS5 family transposase
MRKKINLAPAFPLQLGDSKLEVYAQFRTRYERISAILDSHPGILDAVHRDLEEWGSEGGRESTYSTEQLFRMLIVKCIEGEAFRATVVRVYDSPVLRNFTRVFSGSVPNFTILNTASKKIQPRTWERINAILREGAIAEGTVTGERLRIDSTVCETDIHYPTDSSLLWDVYRTAARLMRHAIEQNAALSIGSRFHDAKIKRLYTYVSTHYTKKSRSAKRKVRRFERVLIERTARQVDVCRRFVAHARTIAMSISTMVWVTELEQMIPLFAQVVEQARRAHRGEVVPASERIFSIFEPHTELLKRGKARKPVEFGHMVSIGQTAQKFITYYNVEEKSRADVIIGDEALNKHKRCFGRLPAEFTADKNYYGGPEHLKAWEEKIDAYAVGKKGNRTEAERAREHTFLFKLLQKFRAGCEGSISVLKRVFGLRRCLNEGFKSFASSIGSMVFCHNLVLLGRL